MFSWKIWYKFISCQEHFRNNRGDCGSLSALDVCGYLSFQRKSLVAKYPNSFFFFKNQLDVLHFLVVYWGRRPEICVYLASKRDPHETAALEKHLLYSDFFFWIFTLNFVFLYFFIFDLLLPSKHLFYSDIFHIFALYFFLLFLYLITFPPHSIECCL